MLLSIQVLSLRHILKDKLIKISGPFLKRPLLAFFVVAIIISLPINKIHSTKMYREYTEGKTVTLSGKVRQIDYNEDDTCKSIVVGNILCYVNPSIEVALHDYVNLCGTIKSFSTPMNYGSFNQKKYYESLNIYCYVNSVDIIILKQANCLAGKLDSLKLNASKKIKHCCQFEAGTICTLILGDKRFLNEARKSLYQSAGVAHFLVISGLHISAIGAVIYKLSKRVFKKQVAISISIAFLVLYGITVGFNISVKRAIIMYCVRLVSYLLKESYDMLSAICLAGTITLILSPYAITSSAFIYSYSTVLIIALYIEYLAPKKKHLVDISFPAFLSYCLAPVSLYLSYSFQPLSALINLILLPFSAPILLIAALAFIFSVLNIHSLATFFDFLLTVILRVLDMLCKLVSSIPDSVILGKPMVIEIIIFYALLIAVIILIKHFPLPKHLIYPWLSIILLLFMAPSIYIPKLSMLYVGQGECVVIRTGTNRAIIMDCGSSSEKEIVKYTVIPFLKASGINQIDAMYASHSDIDHINGFEDLINLSGVSGIKLCKLFIPDSPLFLDETGLSLIETATLNKLPVYTLSQGNTMRAGQCNIVCLWPQKSSVSQDANGESLVTMLGLHNTNVLITGDITQETEKTLIEQISPALLASTDILKIPHHGSKTASCTEFLSASSPKIAIISAGINNRYHHPNSEVTKRLSDLGIPYHVTNQEGEIDIFLYLINE